MLVIKKKTSYKQHLFECTKHVKHEIKLQSSLQANNIHRYQWGTLLHNVQQYINVQKYKKCKIQYRSMYIFCKMIY